MNTKVIAYWATTAFLIFFLLSGAAGELTHQWGTLETVTILGYPVYFLTIIGFWKVLGAMALLVPRFPRLKEWAYAGILFNMTGAAASHAFSGDYGVYAYHVIATVAVAALAVASWALRPPSRRLGEALHLELRDRLKTIPDVNLPVDAIGRRPRLPVVNG